MKTKFFIRNQKVKIHIFFEYRNRHVRFRVKTPYSVKSKNDWDNKRCKIKVPSTTNNAFVINEKLDKILSSFEKDLYENSRFESISLEECKVLYDEILEKELGIKRHIEDNDDQINENDVMSFYEKYISHYSKIPNPITKKILRPKSIKSFESSKGVLQKFLQQKKINKLKFEDINEAFYMDFYKFMTEKGYSTNYIGTVLTKLKTIIKRAFNRDLHQSIEFQKDYFKKIKEDINFPYLNIDEINKIANLELTNETEKNVRDTFVIQCNTGMRIGDLLTFLKEPNYRHNLMSYVQSKTGNEAYAPINKMTQSILDKRDGRMPKHFSSITINRLIKSICKRAEITDNYTIMKTIGGEKKKITKPKCDFITTHCARRSFCTNAYMADVPIQDIMAISGHRKEETFMIYIKANTLQKALKAAQHEYFQ